MHRDRFGFVPQAPSPKPQASSPKSQVPSLKPQAPSPKPQASSPKSQAPSPKPRVHCTKMAHFPAVAAKEDLRCEER
jgi:hypothetical protein